MKEISLGVYKEKEVSDLLESNDTVLLQARRPVLIGRRCLLKINLNLGATSEDGMHKEIEKIDYISKLKYRPDSIMDLSTFRASTPLWQYIMERFDGAIGTVPYYSLFSPDDGINENELLSHIEMLAKNKISFMTLHPTANLRLYKDACEARHGVPMTSRGGYVLLRDQIINKREQNIIQKNYSTILKIMAKHDVVLSIGSVFRAGTIHDALDDIQLKEIQMQKEFIRLAHDSGVKVMMECVGHISFDQMLEYANIVRDINVPLMPLGPMMTDETVGFDHITNAIGSFAFAQTGVLGMINSVTREEHTGEIPSFDSIIEGLQSATVSAHIYNVGRFDSYKKATETIGIRRMQAHTCVQKGGLFDYCPSYANSSSMCSRCSIECPLKDIYN